MAKIKNLLIFLVIAAAFLLIYIYFIKPAPEEAALVSSSGSPEGSTAAGDPTPTDETVGRDFLTLLLSVKSIKLDDSIFSDEAFMSLRDSSIELIPDGNEGRPNPFAPIGTDVIATHADFTDLDSTPLGGEVFPSGGISPTPNPTPSASTKPSAGASTTSSTSTGLGGTSGAGAPR